MGGDGAVGRGLDLTIGDLGNDSAGRGSLDLAVGDLGDNSTRSGGRGLDLSVGDLGDCGLGGGGGHLNLTVGDLGDNGTGSGLDLTVGNLGDNGTGGGLDLAVGNLGDDLGGGSGGLDLTVGELGDGGGDGRGGDLTVSNLGSDTGSGRRSARGAHIDVDLGALGAGRLVVKVVKGTAQALVEDGRVAESESVVAANGPSGSVDSTSLDRAIELELVVGGNVTSTALIVGEDTADKLDGQSLILALEYESVMMHHHGNPNIENLLPGRNAWTSW